MKYEFIKVNFFEFQILALEKKFRKVKFDFDEFKISFEISLGTHLGEGIYKFRIKNSSIPTGKSGGFRIISKVFQNTFLPLLIYSKTEKSNVSKDEIKGALKKILEEV